MNLYAIANGIGFQIAWWAIVLLAAAGHPGLSVAAAALFLAIHLAMVKNRIFEALFLIAAGLTGFVFDTAAMQAGLFTAKGSTAAICPPWLVGLWMVFAAMLHHALAWLRNSLWGSVAVGALGGATGYAAGVGLGALETSLPLLVAAAIWAVIWAPVLPLLYRVGRIIERRLKGGS